jgi:hypothetical protein
MLKAEQSEVKPFVASLSNHERLNRPPSTSSERTVMPSNLSRLKWEAVFPHSSHAPAWER